MAVDILGSLALFQTTLNNVAKVQNDLTQAQIQLSSNQKSQDFAGMASETQQYLALDAIVAKLGQYQNDNQIVLSRVNTTSSVLGQIIDSASELQSLILQRRSGTFDEASFAVQMDGLWQQIAGQLNTNIGGNYLFAGTKNNIPPVDTNFPILAQVGVPDDRYYRGSTDDLTVRADDNVTLTYNVRADHAGFQKIIAAIATAKRGNDIGSDSYLADAVGLIEQGIREVISARATVDATKVSLLNISQNQQALQLYWKGLRESIGNTDIVAVSTQVAVNQGILQATFQAFAKISSLQLSNYLR